MTAFMTKLNSEGFTTLHPTLAMKGDDYGKKHALLKEAGCRCDLFSNRKSTAHQEIQWPIHR